MSGKAVRETLAALGVIASLVFVGTEIRQNTRMARAATRQSLADASLSVIMAIMQDPEMNREFWAWMNAPEDAVLDCTQTRMCVWMLGVARHHENVFIQVEEGVVDESVFDSYGYRNNGPYSSPLFAQYWRGVRGTFDPDFVANFEAQYDLAP